MRTRTHGSMAHCANHKSSLVWLICVCIIFAAVNAQWVVDDDGCRTPDGGAGSCTPIKQCSPILQFLSNAPKPLSEGIKKKLNSYTCGYDVSSVKVCCPPDPIKIEGEGTSSSLTNHKNYHLLPKDCGVLPLHDKIINGQDASLNEFPWMALLSYKTVDGPKFKCGGTVINEKWILTAAHCVTNLNQPLLGVRVGEHNILTKQDCEVQPNGSTKCSEPVQDLTIEKIIPHPGFNIMVIRDDIALLKVTKMNLNTENARPVCLPVDNDARNEEAKNVIVTGWGVTETGRTSNILQKVVLPVVDRNKCQSAYKNNVRVQVTQNQICAGAGKDKKDSCPGDSGGPLHVGVYLNGEARYVQQGIVSFGPKECGLENFPGVYTRVASYVEWILDTIAS